MGSEAFWGQILEALKTRVEREMNELGGDTSAIRVRLSFAQADE